MKSGNLKTKNRNKLDKYLIFSIAVILSYTIVAIIFQIFTGLELSSTLTTGVYAFFGTEIGSCAFVKIFKDKEVDENE